MTDNTKDEREALVAECKRLAGEYAEHYRSTYWLVTGTSPLPWALLQDAIDRLAALPPPDLGHPVALRGGLSDAASQGSDERASDARDAARYRWLRDVGDATWRPFGLREGCSAARADAAIDAAMTRDASTSDAGGSGT